MKLYYTNSQSFSTCLVRVVSQMTGQKLEYVLAEPKMAGKEFAMPMLETKEGKLYEWNAICKYFCAESGKLLGNNVVERSQVDQWVSYVNTKIAPAAETVSSGIFGWSEVKQGAWNDAAKDLKSQVKVLNTALEGNQWLVGNECSLADIVVAQVLMEPLQTVLDAGFRKAMKNFEVWAGKALAVREFIDVNGKTMMCAKPLKPVTVAEAKEPKKPAAAAAPKKEEKPKDNVSSLPKSSWPEQPALYDYKTYFCNDADAKNGNAGPAVDKLMKEIDWEGWAFWYLKYDIMDYEKTDKEHKLNNFVDGFINRAAHTTKMTFGKLGVMGTEGTWEVQGVWLMRGPKEVPDALNKDHSQWEYFKVRKMDPRGNKTDLELLKSYWGMKGGETIEGQKVNKVFWQR